MSLPIEFCVRPAVHSGVCGVDGYIKFRDTLQMCDGNYSDLRRPPP